MLFIAYETMFVSRMAIGRTCPLMARPFRADRSASPERIPRSRHRSRQATGRRDPHIARREAGGFARSGWRAGNPSVRARFLRFGLSMCLGSSAALLVLLTLRARILSLLHEVVPRSFVMEWLRFRDSTFVRDLEHG